MRRSCARLFSTEVQDRLAVAWERSYFQKLSRGFPIKIGPVDGKNRGVVATKPVAKGDAIFWEKPVVVQPKIRCKHLLCSHCLTPATQPHNCDDCQEVYCSDECVDMAEGYHKFICGRLQNLPSLSFPHVIARIYGLTLYDLEVTGTTENSWNHFEHMCRANIPTVPEGWQEMYQLFTSEVIAEEYARVFSLKWFATALATIHLNAMYLDLTTPSHKERIDATAMFARGSYLNHSCEANTGIMAEFPSSECARRSGCKEHDIKHTMGFVALRDIAAGEEVSISYVDEGASYANRQQHLLEHYGFRCTCPACVRESPP